MIPRISYVLFAPISTNVQIRVVPNKGSIAFALFGFKTVFLLFL